MARPVDQERRREIAVAALDVLRTQGLQQATMSGLAKALGLKRPTLYFYFPSIPDLFVALFEILREEEVAFVASRMAGVADPIDALRAYLRAEYDFMTSRGLDDVMLLMASFWASGSDDHRARFRELVLKDLKPVRGMFVALLEHGVKTGALHPFDAESLVDTIMALQDGLLVQGGVRDDLDVERIHAFIVAHLLEPLRVAPGS